MVWRVGRVVCGLYLKRVSLVEMVLRSHLLSRYTSLFVPTASPSSSRHIRHNDIGTHTSERRRLCIGRRLVVVKVRCTTFL